MTNEEILKQAKDALDKALDQKKSNEMLLKSIGPAVIDALKPILNQIKEAVSSIRVDVKPNIEVNPKVDMPRIPAPEVTVNVPDFPKIPTPIVNVPAPIVNIPKLEWPKDKMPIEGWVQLMGVSLQNPLPVQIRDANGKPVDFGGSITQVMGGGGGKHDYFTVKGYGQSAFAELMNADGRLKVSVETGGSGLTDNELRATAVPVSQVSGAMWSVSVSDVFQTTISTNVLNGDNRLRVSVETGGSGLTDSELRASAIPVAQVSGAKWSTEAYQGTSPWVVSATDLDVRDLDFAQDDISVYQVSGHRWSVEATVSGALSSAVVVGPTVADSPDDGNAPVQIGGVARTANPTAVAANDIVKNTYDDLGRQLVRPMQVRDLIVTAYATLTNGTETTLLAASAGSFHDLIYVMGANNSDVAVTVDLRPVTAGNVVMSIQIPASGTAGVSLAVPYPQSGSDTGNNWTADMADITGTSVYLSALFSREI